MTNKHILEQAMASKEPVFLRVHDCEIATVDIPEFGITAARTGGLLENPVTSLPLRRLSYVLTRKYEEDTYDTCPGFVVKDGRLEIAPYTYTYSCFAQQGRMPDFVFDTTAVDSVADDDYGDRAMFFLDCGVKTVYYIDWKKCSVHEFTGSGCVENIKEIKFPGTDIVLDTRILFMQTKDLSEHAALFYNFVSRYKENERDLMWIIHTVLKPMFDLQFPTAMQELANEYLDMIDDLSVGDGSVDNMVCAVECMREFVHKYDEAVLSHEGDGCPPWLNPPDYLSATLQKEMSFVRANQRYVFLYHLLGSMLFGCYFVDETALGIALEECCGFSALSDTLYTGCVSDAVKNEEDVERYEELLERTEQDVSPDTIMAVKACLEYYFGRKVDKLPIAESELPRFYIELE